MSRLNSLLVVLAVMVFSFVASTVQAAELDSLSIHYNGTFNEQVYLQNVAPGYFGVFDGAYTLPESTPYPDWIFNNALSFEYYDNIAIDNFTINDLFAGLFTVSLWFAPDDMLNSDANLLADYTSDGDRNFYISYDSVYNAIIIGAPETTEPFVYPIGESESLYPGWHHFAFVANSILDFEIADTFTGYVLHGAVYIDGVLVQEQDARTLEVEFIAENDGGYGVYMGTDYVGYLDEIRINAEALTVSEIQDIYYATPCDPAHGLYNDGPNGECLARCGDGITAGIEQCDDQNTVDNDACSNACTIKCPAGWKYSTTNNNCYGLLGTATPVTWNQAKSACEALSAGAHLVSIGDQAENDLVYNFVKTEKAYNGNIWIGLEGNTAYTVSGNGSCTSAYTSLTMGRKYAGYIESGTGTVDPYGWCSMPGKENFFRLTPAVSGWWNFKVQSAFDAVIDLYSGVCSSYLECEDYNGINAIDEMEYYLYAGTTYTVVVDKYSTTDFGNYIFEIMAPTDRYARAYSWIDNTNTAYTNWDSGEPNNASGSEACGEMKIGSTTYAKWNDLPCDSTAATHAYVCEYTSAVCGDGTKEGGEQCDDGNTLNYDGCDNNCTTTACGNGILTPGEQCDDGNTVNGDGCDNNCKVTACGNGIMTASEACDDSNLVSGDGCDANCTVTACGNGIITNGEFCDDANTVNGDGCDSNCKPTGCGNGIVTAGESCDDGNTIDGDACNSNCTFPCPTGWTYNATSNRCYGLLGNTSPTTWLAAKTACNAAYNDANMVTISDQAENDFVFNYVKNVKAYNGNIWIGLEANTSYAASGNTTCATALITPNMGRKYNGTIGTGTGTVANSSCVMPGKENFFRFTAGVGGTWTFKVNSVFDAVIDLYSGACTSFLDCEDYNGGNATDTMTISLTAGNTYTVVVDKYKTTDSGTYTLEIMPPTDRGKGAFSWIDDTNTAYTNWDTNEPTGVTEFCGEMKIVTTTNAKWNDLACNNTAVTRAYVCEMRGAICGDGVKTSIEQCDDGNLVSGDGCDSNCKFTSCGNGIASGTEQCDDGDTDNCDGCRNDCTLPTNSCGDGCLAAGEACDDGNAINGDGCDSNCTTTGCGNGIASAGEQCDDGNASNSDACTTACSNATCGDDFLYAEVEDCDDGNTENCDECQNNCTEHLLACGNGCIEGNEDCDDGNLANGDLCNSECKDYNTGFCGVTPVYFSAGMHGWTETLEGTLSEQQSDCQVAAGLWESYCSMNSNGSNAFACCVVNKCDNAFEVNPGMENTLTTEKILVSLPQGSLPSQAKTVTIETTEEYGTLMSPYVENVTDFGTTASQRTHYRLIINNDSALVFLAPITVSVVYYKSKAVEGGNGIAIYTYNENSSQWTRESDSSVNTANKLASASISDNNFYGGSSESEAETPEKNGVNVAQQKTDTSGINPLSGKVILNPPSVDRFGNANVTYPFKIVSDNILSPTLNLRYNSENTVVGEAGIGWSFDTSTISIKTQNIGTPKYDGSEIFLLDGKELIEVGQENGKKVFRFMQEESFWKIVKDGNVFKVYTPDGSTYTYGGQSDCYWFEEGNPNYDYARLYVPGDSNKVFKWFINQQEDKFGNAITFDYYCLLDSDSNISNRYIKEISYGHDQKYRISFAWKNREDVHTNGIYGHVIEETKVIDNIGLYWDTHPINQYLFEHKNSLDTAYKSVLTKVTEKTYDGKIVNVHYFKYNQWGRTDDGLKVNADEYYSEEMQIGPVEFYVDNNYVTKALSHSRKIHADSLGETRKTVEMTDVNGDGLLDQVLKLEDSQEMQVYLGTGSGFMAWEYVIEDGNLWPDDHCSLAQTLWYTLDDGDESSLGIIDTEDFNGDGLLDVIAICHPDPGVTGIRVRINNGHGFKTPIYRTTGSMNMLGSESGYRHGDLNGDGLNDWYHKWEQDDNIILHRNNIVNVTDEEVPLEEWEFPYCTGNVLTCSYRAEGAETTHVEVDMLDINADGLPDRVGKHRSNDYFYVQLNLGNRFKDMGQWAFSNWDPGYCQPDLRCIYKTDIATNPNSHTEIDFVDINGDGLPDRVAKRREYNEIKYQLNKGRSFGEPQRIVVDAFSGFDKDLRFVNVGQGSSSATWHATKEIDFYDFNGDGCPDRVKKTDGNSYFYVQLNQMCQKNRLIELSDAMGNSIKIDYKTEKIAPLDSSISYTDQIPYFGSKQVVSKLSMKMTLAESDIAQANKEIKSQEYEYYKGKYDRIEKRFRGFGKIISTLKENGYEYSKQVETIYNNYTIEMEPVTGDIIPPDAQWCKCQGEYCWVVADQAPESIRCKEKKDEFGLHKIFSKDIDGQVLSIETRIKETPTASYKKVEKKENYYAVRPLYGDVIGPKNHVRHVYPYHEIKYVYNNAGDLIGSVRDGNAIFIDYASGLVTKKATLQLQYDNNNNVIDANNYLIGVEGYGIRNDEIWLNVPVYKEVLKYDGSLTIEIGDTQTITFPQMTTLKRVKYNYDHIGYSNLYDPFEIKASDGIMTSMHEWDKTLDSYLSTYYTYDQEGNVIKEIFPDGVEKKKDIIYESGVAGLCEDALICHVSAIIYEAVNEGEITPYKNYVFNDIYGRVTKVRNYQNEEQITEYDSMNRPIKIWESIEDNLVNTKKYAYAERSGNSYASILPAKYAYRAQIAQDINSSGVVEKWNVIDLLLDYQGKNVQKITRKMIGGVVRDVASGYIARDLQGKVVSQGSPTIENYISGDVIHYRDNKNVSLGHHSDFEYDELGRTVKVTGVDGYIIEKQYDKQIIVQVDGATQLKTIADKEIMFDNSVIGLLNQRKEIAQFKNQRGDQVRQTVKNYNSENTALVEETTDIMIFNDGHIKIIEPTNIAGEKWYDSIGRIKRLYTPDSGRTDYIYNGKGQISEKRYWGTGTTLVNTIEIYFDDNGRLLALNYPDNDASIGYNNDILFEYYATNMLTSPYNRSRTFKKQVGKLQGTPATGFNIADEIYSVEYDRDQYRLNEHRSYIEENVAYDIEYRYDYQGRTRSIKYPDQKMVRYEYNYTGDLRRIYETDQNNITVNEYISDISYDQYGHKTKVSYGNNVTTEYLYRPGGSKLEKMITKAGSQVLQNYTYDYHIDGNIQAITDSTAHKKINQIPIYLDIEQSFDYDLRGSISGSDGTGGGQNYEQSYKFDGSDRITKKTDGQYQYEYIYQETHKVNETIRYNSGVEESREKYKYDLLGNRIKHDSVQSNVINARTCYSYDKANRLALVKDARGVINSNDDICNNSTFGARYKYDDRGARMIKEIEKYEIPNQSEYAYRKTLYVGIFYDVTTREDNIIDSQDLKKKYIFDGQHILAIKKINDGTVSYLHQNNIGSTVMVTNNEGTVTETYKYLPFGEIWLENKQEAETEILFANKPYDSETGFYYMESRYYDPETISFLTPDAKMDGMNHMGYVRGNPIRYIDPSGQIIEEIVFGVIIGIIMGTVSSGMETGWDPVQTYFGALVGGFLGGLGAGLADLAITNMATFQLEYGMTVGQQMGKGFGAGLVKGAITGTFSGIANVTTGQRETVGSALQKVHQSMVMGAAFSAVTTSISYGFATPGKPLSETQKDKFRNDYLKVCETEQIDYNQKAVEEALSKARVHENEDWYLHKVIGFRPVGFTYKYDIYLRSSVDLDPVTTFHELVHAMQYNADPLFQARYIFDMAYRNASEVEAYHLDAVFESLMGK